MPSERNSRHRLFPSVNQIHKQYTIFYQSKTNAFIIFMFEFILKIICSY